MYTSSSVCHMVHHPKHSGLKQQSLLFLTNLQFRQNSAETLSFTQWSGLQNGSFTWLSARSSVQPVGLSSSYVGLSLRLLGLPHSMAAGLHEQEFQEAWAEATRRLMIWPWQSQDVIQREEKREFVAVFNPSHTQSSEQLFNVSFPNVNW